MMSTTVEYINKGNGSHYGKRRELVYRFQAWICCLCGGKIALVVEIEVNSLTFPLAVCLLAPRGFVFPMPESLSE